MICKKCKSDKWVKNGVKGSKQRWKCISCGYETTEPSGTSLEYVKAVRNEFKVSGNILFASDFHIPFMREDAPDFLRYVVKDFDCRTIVLGGDIFDVYSLSRYVKDPDSLPVKDEFKKAKEEVSKLVKLFPSAYCIYGNHELRINKKLADANIPMGFLKSFNDIWGLPSTWEWSDYFDINGIRFMHGDRSGQYAHVNIAKDMRQSIVMGHTHSTGGVEYMANHGGKIFGANAGCLINDKTYAFAYAKDATKRPVLGCIVVETNKDNRASFIPLN